jgi:hypothetical protein
MIKGLVKAPHLWQFLMQQQEIVQQAEFKGQRMPGQPLLRSYVLSQDACQGTLFSLLCPGALACEDFPDHGKDKYAQRG